MVARRPLVLVDGKKTELPVGDTVEGVPTGGGSPFLPPPDLVDHLDVVFFYYGWENVNGDWLVRRTVRATGFQDSATSANNPSIPDLAAAFPDRATLTYS